MLNPCQVLRLNRSTVLLTALHWTSRICRVHEYQYAYLCILFDIGAHYVFTYYVAVLESCQDLPFEYDLCTICVLFLYCDRTTLNDFIIILGIFLNKWIDIRSQQEGFTPSYALWRKHIKYEVLLKQNIFLI